MACDLSAILLALWAAVSRSFILHGSVEYEGADDGQVLERHPRVRQEGTVACAYSSTVDRQADARNEY